MPLGSVYRLMIRHYDLIFGEDSPETAACPMMTIPRLLSSESLYSLDSGVTDPSFRDRSVSMTSTPATMTPHGSVTPHGSLEDGTTRRSNTLNVEDDFVVARRKTSVRSRRDKRVHGASQEASVSFDASLDNFECDVPPRKNPSQKMRVNKYSRMTQRGMTEYRSHGVGSDTDTDCCPDSPLLRGAKNLRGKLKMAETPKSVSVDSGETLVNYGETSRSPIFDMSLSCEELCSGQEPLLDREDEGQDRAPNEGLRGFHKHGVSTSLRL